MRFRGENAVRHTGFRSPSHQRVKPVTFLKKQAEFCSTFDPSINAKGVSLRANRKSEPVNPLPGSD
jgi:hypothetical protein